jgi:hypothetical protein
MRLMALLGLTLLLAAPAARAQERRGGLDADRIVDLVRESAAAEAASRLDRTGDAETAEDRAVAREVRRTLAARRVTVNFDKTPFEECVDFLRDVTEMNIVVSRGAREALKDVEVSLRLRNIRLKSCLELLLQQADPDLRYGVRHGVLTIGLKDEWRSAMRLELYFVGDLLHQPPDFPGPKMGLGPDGVTIERRVRCFCWD